MKKLLSVLAAFTLSVTPITSVVACGSSSKKEKEDEIGTNTILKGGSLGQFTSEDFIKRAHDEDLFGSKNQAIENFMKYFAFQMFSQLMDKSSDIYKTIKDQEGKGYVNDFFLKTVEDQWKISYGNAETEWNRQVETAKKTGKKWEEDFRKNLEKEYNRKFNSYTDAKDIVINSVMMKATEGVNVADALKNSINNIPNSKPTNSFQTIISNFGTVILSQKITINNQTINLPEAYVPGNNIEPIDQYKNLLKALDGIYDWNNNTFSALSIPIINLINATGGLHPTDVKDNNIEIDNITWVTRDNFKVEVLDKAEEFGTQLAMRIDSNFATNYNNGKKTNSISSIGLNGKNINFAKYTLMDSYVSMASETAPAQSNNTRGLLSNSQRYFANNFFETQKPVGISEVVIAPLTGNGNLANNINNAGYVGAEGSTNNLDTDSLYSFMSMFVNKEQWASLNGATTSGVDNTKIPLENTSNYSWDLLMNQQGNLKNFTTASPNGGYDWTEKFISSTSLKQHEKLLTINSSSSDFSDVLKYSVYDFIANGANEQEYKANPNPVAKTVDDGTVATDANNKSGSAVSNFINSINRRVGSDATNGKNVYQVLNAKQGIIGFVDTDGIHILRIEGYEKLNSSDLLKDQTSITANWDGKKADELKTDINNYQGIQALNDNMSKKENAGNLNALKEATYDYNGKRTDSFVNYNDLNTSFGNEYLRFLVNSSIVSSIAGTNTTPKEKYNINSEIENYISSKTPTSLNPTNDWIAVWNYFKEVLGKTSDQLFTMLFGGPEVNKLLGIDNYSDKTANAIKAKYRNYILEGISTFNPWNTSNNNFSTSWTNWVKTNSSVSLNDPNNKWKPLATLGNQTSITIATSDKWWKEKEAEVNKPDSNNDNTQNGGQQ
ncbi:lipoprotein [Mesoplasma lactucae]|uniref:Uncharacterized protein n=1 Tax=Mesoplasma lactucae ATCC 49193 TaxID=81460 RepID=A0A291IRE9_9MOLU|nr:lipoprotein [Mesoplasma lactucae]ATG97515.1 hypothetical protein CP520_01975 [Mesoplasma lactucae ATCC 49193]ATZ20029.1 hypothetical protein MLACT_v1c02070 [Mesoplasma lactucae ATCC 49193]MCL8217020.1 hypothetical protein [Mesoplasma lactucae ATCC 49193]